MNELEELLNMFNWAAKNPDIANISLSNENGEWSICSVERIMADAFRPIIGKGSSVQDAMVNWNERREFLNNGK